METLKVGAKSNPKSVAGAIAAVVERDGQVDMFAVGAGAVNQAVKSIAIARGYVAPKGINLVAIISFSKLDINDAERTAMKFSIKSENL